MAWQISQDIHTNPNSTLAINSSNYGCNMLKKQKAHNSKTNQNKTKQNIENSKSRFSGNYQIMIIYTKSIAQNGWSLSF